MGEQRHQGNQRNILNSWKSKGKLFNTHQNSARNHQGSSTISQNHFSFDLAEQRGMGRWNRTRSTSHRIKPSDRITHPGTIIPGLTHPPTSDIGTQQLNPQRVLVPHDPPPPTYSRQLDLQGVRVSRDLPLPIGGDCSKQNTFLSSNEISIRIYAQSSWHLPFVSYSSKVTLRPP